MVGGAAQERPQQPLSTGRVDVSFVVSGSGLAQHSGGEWGRRGPWRKELVPTPELARKHC